MKPVDPDVYRQVLDRIDDIRTENKRLRAENARLKDSLAKLAQEHIDVLNERDRLAERYVPQIGVIEEFGEITKEAWDSLTPMKVEHKHLWSGGGPDAYCVGCLILMKRTP